MNALQSRGTHFTMKIDNPVPPRQPMAATLTSSQSRTRIGFAASRGVLASILLSTLLFAGCGSLGRTANKVIQLPFRALDSGVRGVDRMLRDPGRVINRALDTTSVTTKRGLLVRGTDGSCTTDETICACRYRTADGSDSPSGEREPPSPALALQIP